MSDSELGHSAFSLSDMAIFTLAMGKNLKRLSPLFTPLARKIAVLKKKRQPNRAAVLYVACLDIKLFCA